MSQKQKLDTLSEMTLIILSIVLIVVLYFLFHIFIVSVFASALISAFIVMLIVYYIMGREVIVWPVIILAVAGVIIELVTRSIDITVTFLFGLCVLLIIAVMLKG